MKKSIYNINVKTIFGEEQALSQYEGKVLLIVNGASQCGFTPQYSGLQNLYEKYEDRGFRILVFPSNDFGRQEPGSDEEIKEFCRKKFGITFDLFSKVKVVGSGKSPIYQYLQEFQLTPIKKSGIQSFIMRGVTKLLLGFRKSTIPEPYEVKWNFNKFLIDKNGFPVASFSSEVEPNSPVLIEYLEKELGK